MLARSPALRNARRLQDVRLGFRLQKDYLHAMGHRKLSMALGVRGFPGGEKQFISYRVNF